MKLRSIHTKSLTVGPRMVVEIADMIDQEPNSFPASVGVGSRLSARLDMAAPPPPPNEAMAVAARNCPGPCDTLSRPYDSALMRMDARASFNCSRCQKAKGENALHQNSAGEGFLTSNLLSCKSRRCLARRVQSSSMLFSRSSSSSSIEAASLIVSPIVP